MTRDDLRAAWQAEEDIAHIQGWDFSHIHGRYEEENDLPWNYEEIVRSLLTQEAKLLDFDTGGGEFLLSLGHPHENTAATDGYPPNIELCQKKLTPIGITFKVCSDASKVPFPDGSFDIMLNRHGDFNADEAYRLLKQNGLFITEQVGGENDRDLVEMVLPGLETSRPELRLDIQQQVFEKVGFKILRAEEAFRPIRFYDTGAFVWFAKIIEWEFPGFSVDRCFDRLLKMQEELDRNGKIEGTIHRYLIVAKKKTVGQQDVDK